MRRNKDLTLLAKLHAHEVLVPSSDYLADASLIRERLLPWVLGRPAIMQVVSWLYEEDATICKCACMGVRQQHSPELLASLLDDAGRMHSSLCALLDTLTFALLDDPVRRIVAWKGVHRHRSMMRRVKVKDTLRDIRAGCRKAR